MRHLFGLISRFRRDERGAFGVIFAVLAIVLVAMSGAVVDFTSMQQARTRTQVALDAAALALQPTIYTASTTTIQGQAQALLADRLADTTTTWADCTKNGNVAPCATVILPTVNTTTGQLTLTANLKVQMNFVSLVGVQTLQAQIVSVATRQKLNLEVAMVLDNSGSMTTTFGTGTRLSVLKSSANCAANILFYNVKDCTTSVTGKTVTPDVKMALVPFNDEVNVGASHASDFWIDRTGGSNTFDNDNFDNDDNTSTAYTATTDRIALFNKISYNGTALSWGGCVEARVNDGGSHQYDTDDTLPVAGVTNTLFTPLFAPDEPDITYPLTTTTTSHGHTTTTTNNYNYDNNYISDTPKACDYVLGNCSVATAVATSNPIATVETDVVTVKNTSGTTTSGPTTTTTNSSTSSTTTTTTATLTTPAGVVTTGPSVCSCTGETLLTNTSSTSVATPKVVTTGPTTTTVNNKNSRGTVTGTTTTVVTIKTTTPTSTTTGTQTCVDHYTPTITSARVLQERLCKYNGTGASGAMAVMSTRPSIGFGPNEDCPASAIQPLTDTPATITTAVNGMAAAGNTNIQEGTAWGFRVLSPGEPFTEGLGYDKATSKVMIVMTDGENTYDDTDNMNGSELYAAYAYPYNNYNTGTAARGRMGAVGWAASAFEAQINTRLATTCTNAKAAGITVYTIGLATSATSDPTGNTTLLTNCASESDYAFFPTSASQLQDAFVNIANQLAALRLAK